jgi:hypothetical protein
LDDTVFHRISLCDLSVFALVFKTAAKFNERDLSGYARRQLLLLSDTADAVRVRDSNLPELGVNEIFQTQLKKNKKIIVKKGKVDSKNIACSFSLDQQHK